MSQQTRDERKCEPTRVGVLLSVLENHFQTLTCLCNALENVADKLPDKIDNQQCLYIARSIYPVIKSAHEFEEKSVFPYVTKNPELGESSEIINRLHAEHWEDESFASELQEALTEFVTHRDQSNPEALGYMLRGFFEGVRRHMAFEKIYFPLQFKQIVYIENL